MAEVMSLAEPAGSRAPVMSGVHPDTLGYLAVLEPEASGGRQIALNIVREQLDELSPQQAGLFDRFCRAAVPLDLQAAKGPTPDMQWSTWLVRNTSNQELMDFLAWNVGSVREQQADDEFQELLEAEREIFRDGIAGGIQEGWLHPDYEAAREGVGDLEVYVGDGFTTHARGFDGYHIRGTKQVVLAGAKRILATGFTGLYTTVRWAARHEFNHPFGLLDPRWMDEAATEHTAQAYKYGQPEIVLPNGRKHNISQAYAEGRAVASHFSGRLLTRAYSQIEGTDCLEELIDDFNQEWRPFVPKGKTAFGQLNLLMGTLEAHYGQSALSPARAGEEAASEVKRMFGWNPRAVFATYDSPEDFQRLLRK